MGWSTGLGNILTVMDSNELIGTCSLSMAKSLSMTSDSAANHQQWPTWAAQSSEESAKLLIDALVPHAKAKVHTCMGDWKVDNVCQGAILHKCIINDCSVDNNHSTKHINDWLEGMPEFIVSCHSDLIQLQLNFNETKGLCTDHGKSDIKFIKYLWQSYKVCKDSEFGKKWSANRRIVMTITTTKVIACTLSVPTRTTIFGIKVIRGSRNSDLQGRNWIIELKIVAGYQEFEELSTNWLIWHHKCCQQNKKEEAPGGFRFYCYQANSNRDSKWRSPMHVWSQGSSSIQNAQGPS